MAPYKPKTEMFEHQKREFEKSKDLMEYGVFWEQGTGKTKFTLDTVGHNYVKGVVDCVFVLAPNGIERNWLTDEIPAHVPDDIIKDSAFFHYKSKSSKTKRFQREMNDALNSKAPLLWIFISYDAFMTKQGKEFAKKVLKGKRKVAYIVDESARIKSPKAKRTKTIVDSGQFGTLKRVLSGTPVANSPFDVYSQIKFLKKDFWNRFGWSSFSVFKERFGVFVTGYNKKVDKQYTQCVGFQNLDLLYKALACISSRETKEKNLDLPDKLYKKVYFDLSPEQEKLYRKVKDEIMVFLESGDTVTSLLAVTRLLRLQQVTCGYIPVDLESDKEEKKFHLCDPVPARLECLKEILEDLSGQCIIWARFTKDIDLIEELLKQQGETYVRYDGKVSQEGRAEGKEKFQKEEARFFLGNPAVGSEGLTLIGAKTTIYYNNSFKLTERLQSEDRNHRIGQKNSVLYIDIIAADTVDEKIVKALRDKKEIASIVLGDELREWI